MQITIQRAPDAPIETVDDAGLLRTEGVIDTDVERTTWVEYCWPDCPGLAHRTGQAAAAGTFCDRHIHRSVAMQLKQGLELFAAGGTVG